MFASRYLVFWCCLVGSVLCALMLWRGGGAGWYWPMGILGAPPEVMIYVNVLVTAIGFLIHSKIDADWGWFGRWVIQSPR